MSSGRRGRPKDEYNAQVVAALRKVYPKFSNTIWSIAKAEHYGVQLSPEALSVLRACGIPEPSKAPEKSIKKIQRRNKNNKLTVRLNDAQKVRFDELLRKSGCKTVQEYLEYLIEKENENAV